MRLNIATAAMLVATSCAACSSNFSSRTATAPAPAVAIPAPNPQTAELFRPALARLNYYRTMAKLPVLADDAGLDDGASKHARYVVENHLAGDATLEDGRLKVQMFNQLVHQEVPGKPGYTAAGAGIAFGRCWTITAPMLPKSGEEMIDQIVTMPLVMILALDPQLSLAGFGSYCEAGTCAAVIATNTGLPKEQYVKLFEGVDALRWNPANGPIPFTPAPLRSPLMFPPANSTIDLTSYRGGDFPDPLASCGYTAPTGLPILLELGQQTGLNSIVRASNDRLLEDGNAVDHCMIDAATYASAKGEAEQMVQRGFWMYGAVVMIPRRPLRPGHTYTVSMTAYSQTYKWSFRVGRNAK
jgi:hypothetical protein